MSTTREPGTNLVIPESLRGPYPEGGDYQDKVNPSNIAIEIDHVTSLLENCKLDPIAERPHPRQHQMDQPERGRSAGQETRKVDRLKGYSIDNLSKELEKMNFVFPPFI